MQKQIFYRLDSKGKVRQWAIEVVTHSDILSEIITEDGCEGGKLKGSRTEIIKGLGKNSIYEQAVADAQTEINKKVKQGYGLDRTQMKQKGQTATIDAPMKGLRYHPLGEAGQKSAKTLDQLGIRGKKVGIQVKLDGHRYRIVVNKQSVTFYSSGGDVVPSYPQVEKVIRERFDKYICYWENKYGVTEHILDGEMYSHDVLCNMQWYDSKEDDTFTGFSLIQKACGAKLPASVEHVKEIRDKMQFHLFDIVSPAPYTTRNKILDSYADGKSIVKVETVIIDANETEIEKMMADFLSKGYEGLMIRQLDMPYEHKKGKQLLKYKPEEDEEFQIIGFDKSIAGPTLGALVCKTATGIVFRTSMKEELGKASMKQKIWDNQKDYLGKWVTVTFLNYTPDGKPRNPKAKCFRKGKSID